MIVFEEPEGATPLGPDEIQALIPQWIATRADLNAAEERNILQAITWASRARTRDHLSDAFVRALHRRMFGDVWHWAGTLRRHETNIGIDPSGISIAIVQLLDDVRYWIDHQTYERDEIAVRLHHRLVSIHPFPNGNGRHTRLLADLTVQRLKAQPFTWGRGNLTAASATRSTYLSALRAADAHDIAPLLAFARS